jgi:hypothetical protein
MDRMERGVCARATSAGSWGGLSTIITAVLGFSGAGCNSSPFTSMACTTVGCHDQFAATISVASSTVPPGIHTVAVTADGVTLSCSFAFPPETLAGGGTVGPQCPIGLTVDVQPTTVCTTIYTDAATIERCDPVPGQFTELIAMMGTPAAIRVRQSVGGTVILDQSATPTYQSNQPNGPGCDPICHQAGAEWTISARVPIIHRAVGSACPSQRGPGLVCTGGTSTGTNQCVTDGDCSAGTNGRCFSPNGPGPGACSPTICSYDQCQSDSDCAALVPCECRSSQSDGANLCVAGGNCATDSDCGPQGYCSPGALTDYCATPIYFCHSANDTCVDDSDCRAIVADSGILQTCNYDSQSGHFACGDTCIPPP